MLLNVFKVLRLHWVFLLRWIVFLFIARWWLPQQYYLVSFSFFTFALLHHPHTFDIVHADFMFIIQSIQYFYLNVPNNFCHLYSFYLHKKRISKRPYLPFLFLCFVVMPISHGCLSMALNEIADMVLFANKLYHNIWYEQTMKKMTIMMIMMTIGEDGGEW